jgi:hypothetical protein
MYRPVPPAATNPSLPVVDRAGESASVIPGVRGSVLHGTCVETYRRHRGDRNGLCVWCQRRSPCPSRLDAARVIEAAGEDPQLYDRSSVQLSVRVPSPGPEPVARRARAEQQPVGAAVASGAPATEVLSATVIGYALGGVGRPKVPYYGWER